MNKIPGSKTISVRQMARELGISDGLAYAAVQRGEIKAIRVGNRWIIPRAVLDKLLAGETAVGGTQAA